MKSLKNIFACSLVVISGFAGSALLSSCIDDNSRDYRTEADREFMTMFITDNTRGKGGDYPYNCGLDASYPHGNTIHLYWYGVNDCAGYQVQMSTQIYVAGGAEAWANVQGNPQKLMLDTILGPDVLDLLIKDQLYSTSYRFAIRALSKRDANIKGDESTFAHASAWWGHGGGREWQDYLGIQTYDRYDTPYAVYVDQSLTTETTMRVMINSNICDVLPLTNPNDPSGLSDEDKDKYESFTTNFNVAEDGTFGFKYLTVEPSPSNPTASVGAKWKKYEITDADRERGYVDIDGLSKNATYVINVIDPSVTVAIDAKYNTCTTRSDGTPGEPILLKHDEQIAKYANANVKDREIKRSDVFAMAEKFGAAPISPDLSDFISNADLAEGQTFLLEGGKIYYMDGNDVTSKGFVLRTDPADVAKGLRAKVLCGLGHHPEIYTQGTNGDQWQSPYSMFVFGRSPEPGEGGEIYMKKLAFYDIDFDNPLAFNYGDNAAGIGTATGNYFFNMFSDGMAVTLDSLVIDNCSFKRVVRGFIREQGPNYKIWNHVLIHNNQFFDSGYYSNGAGGYPWIAGAGTNAKTNLYKDIQVTENTFFDCPFPQFFNEVSQSNWQIDAPWNITFSNNTLVNFNTRAAGNIYNMRYLPNGSIFRCENNLICLTKQEGDLRVLGQWGADIRETMTQSDGTPGKVTLYFNNNWSTNNDLTNGQIFSGNAWTSTSNNWGKLVKNGDAILNGTLEVNVASVSATDLMVNPNPPFKAATANDQNMHRADALDGSVAGTGVDLHIKHTDNEIYKNNVGAARWRK